MTARWTVADLIDAGGRVRWRCDVGQGHYGDADLRAIARAMGGDYSLANKRPRCRIPGCPGRVLFEDFSGAWPRALDTITDRDPAWWAHQDQRRAELEALGYRVKMGKWVGPRR